MVVVHDHGGQKLSTRPHERDIFFDKYPDSPTLSLTGPGTSPELFYSEHSSASKGTIGGFMTDETYDEFGFTIEEREWGAYMTNKDRAVVKEEFPELLKPDCFFVYLTNVYGEYASSLRNVAKYAHLAEFGIGPHGVQPGLRVYEPGTRAFREVRASERARANEVYDGDRIFGMVYSTSRCILGITESRGSTGGVRATCTM